MGSKLTTPELQDKFRNPTLKLLRDKLPESAALLTLEFALGDAYAESFHVPAPFQFNNGFRPQAALMTFKAARKVNVWMLHAPTDSDSDCEDSAGAEKWRVGMAGDGVYTQSFYGSLKVSVRLGDEHKNTRRVDLVVRTKELRPVGSAARAEGVYIPKWVSPSGGYGSGDETELS